MFRRIFILSVGLMLVLGLVALAGTDAQAHDELELRIFLGADFPTFDSTLGGTTFLGGAAFHVSGVICKNPTLLDDCSETIGTFHCWGWALTPGDGSAGGVVSQEYNLDGRGKILLTGFEDTGPRPVVGGTGDFSEVRGEATGFDFDSLDVGEFIATFRLIDDDDSSDDDSSD